MKTCTGRIIPIELQLDYVRITSMDGRHLELKQRIIKGPSNLLGRRVTLAVRREDLEKMLAPANAG